MSQSDTEYKESGNSSLDLHCRFNLSFFFCLEDFEVSRSWLHDSEDYAASPSFLRSSCWYSESMSKDYLYGADGLSPKWCTLVGIVASERLAVSTHGDFDPMDDSRTFASSALKFSLQQPDVPGFHEDFKKGLRNIGIMVNFISTKDHEDYSPMIQCRNGATVVDFVHPLFEEQTRE